MKLFSYVVEHDTGLAPNPNNGSCTLVYCKFSNPKVRTKNVVELAELGDWIIGTGGKSRKSSGHGTIIYIMRVDEKLSFAEYFRRFPDRAHPVPLFSKDHGKFALVSRTFLYFGKKAITADKLPAMKLLDHRGVEKKGPAFRNNFSEAFIRQLADWVHKQHPRGKIGEPCVPGRDGIPKKPCRCRKLP
jgi:hypothetical protein